MTKLKASNDSTETCAEAPRSGRPRCEASRKAILEAVWRLLKKSSLAALSIEAIAREAGVGKTTIYRWWPSKAAVAMDAFLMRYLPETDLPAKGSPVERLRTQMTSIIKIYRGPVGRLIADILAEGQSDPDVLRLFREHFVARRRKATRDVIVQGQDAGLFDGDVDPDLAMDILYGPIYFRLLSQHLPLDSDFASDLPARAMRCLLMTRPRASGTSRS